MKKYFTPLLFLVLLACDDETIEPTRVGQWQLFEVLADPGDGSGTFMPTDNRQELKLFSNLSFISTESLCRQFGSDPSSVGIGTYDTTQMVIVPEGCSTGEQQIEYNFEIDENGHLILYFPCIEPCASKYRKIQASMSSE